MEAGIDAAANAFDLFLGPGVASPTPTVSSIVDEGPQRTIRRYLRADRQPPTRGPVLLVPPLGAPIDCFDLHRGASLAQHLVCHGYDTYVVDYGPISFDERRLGLEHWVDAVIPAALRSVSAQAGGAPPQAIGWCLGGIMTLLALAAQPDLPLAGVVAIASPFDLSRVPLLGPIRNVAALTGGNLESGLYRLMGGIPAPLVSIGFQLTAPERYLARPLFLLRNLADREALAHTDAVDRYMRRMVAYPGRTIGQLYHSFFRANELAGGRVELGRRVIDVRDVRVPVLAIAGDSDGLAPEAAVHHVAHLLAKADRVRVTTAPGGHLGVLTGMSARETTWVELVRFLAHQEGEAAG